MTPEHWRKVEELFEATVAHPGSERATFLAEACAGDGLLQQEVAALLASDGAAEDPLEEIASSMAAGWVAEIETQEAELVGQTVGRYRLLARLGAGGMGEVFLAQDTTLDRKAAIKLFPRRFTQDHERLRM